MSRLIKMLAQAMPPDASATGLLTDYWRDVLNWMSMGIGVVSLLVSVAGLWYSILSWRAAGKARDAANAAKQAAEDTRAESRRRFEAFAAGKLRGHLQQAFDHLHHREWGKAAIHLREVSDAVGHFAVEDETWQQSANDLLEMENICAGWEAKRRKTGYYKKWNSLLRDVQARLPAYQRPV